MKYYRIYLVFTFLVHNVKKVIWFYVIHKNTFFIIATPVCSIECKKVYKSKRNLVRVGFFGKIYKKFFQGVFFCFLKLGLESASGYCIFHYFWKFSSWSYPLGATWMNLEESRFIERTIIPCKQYSW